MYGGFQHNAVPPGGIIPGTATGVNPYPNNKPNVNLGSYLNNTPTTTANFAAPPSFAPQASANPPYVPHGAGGQQWNAGAAQPNTYGQAGVPGHPAQPGFPPVAPTGFGAPTGYQQPDVAPSTFNTTAYGAQAPQGQPSAHGGGFYPGQTSGGPSFGATYAGSVSGPQYTQPQDAFQSNHNARPGGFGQYASPPAANVHQPPPNAYGQQPTYGQPGFNAAAFPSNNQVPTNAPGQFGAAVPGSYTGFNQQQPAQPAQHQGWPTTTFAAPNPTEVQNISQQWAQNNQQTQPVDPNHSKRYSVASIAEPYHSAYATATPPPPAAPKPERPATSATFFAATAGALKTPAPDATSPPPAHSQPKPVTSQAAPATASGFAGGGIGDWEHYGDFDGDDDDETKPGTSHENAAEVHGDTHAVEMAAATPPPAKQQQPAPPVQQPPNGGISSPSQVQGLPTNTVGAVNQPNPTGPQGNQQPLPGPWGSERPQSGGPNPAGLQFQNFGPPNIPPPAQNQPVAPHPILQNLQQPYRTSSPSHGNQFHGGYNGQPPYQQSPVQTIGSPQNAGVHPYGVPQNSQSYQLTEQLRKQQEEQLLRQQQEQQAQIQAQIQAQLQQQQLQQQLQEQQKRQSFIALNQSPSQPIHQYGLPHQSPPAQNSQPPAVGLYQSPNPVQSPGAFAQGQNIPPPQGTFTSPPPVVDAQGQQLGHQKQPSLGATSQIPIGKFGQDPNQQQQLPQEDRIQSPPANQYGQPTVDHQRNASLNGPIAVPPPEASAADQQIVEPASVQGLQITPKQHQGAPIQEAAAAEGLETISIPSDLEPYYKESIRKFVKMILREASAKSSVESLRIFTEFMEDETYSRGDRYSDAPLHDYISDVSKGYSFAGRLRPYTTDSPDPYERRGSVPVENPNIRRDNTLDSIDSPLTHAIEALRASGGRKGGQSPSSVEHRLPYTIEEKDEPVAPLNSQNHHSALHTSPPPQTGSVKNTTVPYPIPEDSITYPMPEEAVPPMMHHHSTWGTPPEPRVQDQAPIQPLNLKRHSIAGGFPANTIPHKAPTASPSVDSETPNEVSLAQQAALLAAQWRENKVNNQTDKPPTPEDSFPQPLQKRQSVPPGQFPGQFSGQFVGQYSDQIPSQSPRQNQSPYQQPPHFDSIQAPPHTQSPIPKQDPYQQPPAQQLPTSPPQAMAPVELHTQSPPQANVPYQQPLTHISSFPKNYEELPAQHEAPGPEPQQYVPPTSPPKAEPLRQIEIPEPDPIVVKRERPSIDSSLDAGYVMVSPQPEQAPIAIDISSPIYVKSTPPELIAASQRSKVDVAVLSSILGQDRKGVPDKTHLLAPIRDAFEKVGSNFSELDKMRKAFEVEAKKIRDKNEAERDRLKSEHDEYTEELYSQQKILYEDLHDIDEQFNTEQNALKEKQEKEEFDKFNKDIFTPVYNMIQERIVELKKQQKSLLTFIKTASSGREKFDPQINKPNLQDALLVLLDLHELLEVHYMKLQEAIADRDKRFKSTVLTPLYASNNYAKLRDAKKYFDEEEKKAVVKAATDGNDRAKALKAVIDDSMIPGLDLEFGFFDEVEQCVTKIIEGLPENPKEYNGDLKLLYEELEYASNILETLTNTQASMFKLYHQVNSGVGKTEKAIAVAQAKQKGDKPDLIKKIGEDKDAQMQTLDEELKERLEDVNGHFAEAKTKLEPILAKYKAASEGK
ncbi:hypothetical protein TWF694_004107 [Orbilia ellipsospora]|uniref:Uncharacterized protein n=1 Tax=Orbilia ellipsospora TaxID=2528407 RepID=A0AAV9WZJ8_9PEZI